MIPNSITLRSDGTEPLPLPCWVGIGYRIRAQAQARLVPAPNAYVYIRSCVRPWEEDDEAVGDVRGDAEFDR